MQELPVQITTKQLTMAKAYNIKTIIESVRDDYNDGKITLREAAIRFCKAGWDNFIDEKATAERIGI